MIGTKCSFSCDCSFLFCTLFCSKLLLVLSVLLICRKQLSIALTLGVALIVGVIVIGDSLLFALSSVSIVLVDLCLVACYLGILDLIDLGLTDGLVKLLVEVLGYIPVSVLVIGTKCSFSCDCSFLFCTLFCSKLLLVLSVLLICRKQLSIALTLGVALIVGVIVIGEKLCLTLSSVGICLIYLRFITCYFSIFDIIDLGLTDSIIEILVEVLGYILISVLVIGAKRSFGCDCSFLFFASSCRQLLFILAVLLVVFKHISMTVFSIYTLF